jgi:putative transferase (TIGR04331 family)
VNRLNQENEKNIFLATTALEEFWDTTKPIVFLGDWCLQYSRRNVWKPLNGDVLQSVWKDKKRFLEAYIYSQDVYERLLQQTAALLDEVHGEKHDMRYWRIIIGPWLFHYIDVLYNRYLSIQDAISKYESFDTIVLHEDSFITPRSTLEFVNLSTDDPYNIQIYSRILSAKGYNFRRKSCDIVKRKAQLIRKENLLNGIMKKLIKTCIRRIALVKMNKSVYLPDPYFLKKSSIIKIFLKSKGKVKPIFPTNEEIPIATLNKNMRSFFKKVSLNNNGFEKLIEQLLPYDIPYIFLESYKMMKKESLNYPSKPRAIMSWVSWYFNDKFKLWAAAAAESGSSLYGAQHGGNYGIDQYMQALDHEVAITDKFYSWGWTYPELHERIVPMPASKTIGKKKFEKKKNNNILFAGNALPRYLHILEYHAINHLGKYCEDQIRFFKGVGLSYQKIIRYRALIKDNWLDIVKQIQGAFPDLVMDDWGIPFQESLMNCKLFVCDHLGTVYAEALSLNTPTILFWDPESYIHRSEARRYLENLHTAGILHYSPESAASKVCEIYDNVDDWWNERERQLARLDFCDHYAKNSPNAIDEWINEFRKISG